MNEAMFIVGFCIFTAYVGFLIWNIFYNNRKQREENYPGYYTRHNQPDNLDMDGMGNFGRFPHNPYTKKRKKNVKSKKKTFNSYRSS